MTTRKACANMPRRRCWKLRISIRRRLGVEGLVGTMRKSRYLKKIRGYLLLASVVVLSRGIETSAALEGRAVASDANSLIRTTHHDNLDVLPAGPLPPNPAELVGGFLGLTKASFNFV